MVRKILEMFQRSRRANRAFIWKLVRMEHERITREYQSFGKWELLAAVQELIVHVLMRIVEGPQEYLNFDTQITLSIVKVIGTVYHVDITSACPFAVTLKASPLPSQQALWCAYNELDWNVEYSKNIKQSRPHGILSNGDLVSLQSGVGYNRCKKPDRDDWYAGADNLGILVIMVANIR
ncbi:hypothetical protein Trco_007126 [Trichoderma cornu-damae]|uniref:Uncharacterized protein n=1 Tax=Trichoderma cornu-damae TaxID=654480 RepID=A0A9P8TUE7_9HYPO|nr:hypothetical protein Trco_007126 [Trichoderma cornu-damae]